MKWDCGPTGEEKRAAKLARLAEWHPFFALLPRRVGQRDCRWLETIERRMEFHEYRGRGYICWWTREYRARGT